MSSTSAPTQHRPGTGRGTSSCAEEPVSPSVPHPFWRRGGTRPSGNQFSPHPVPQAAHSILSQAWAGMGEGERRRTVWPPLGRIPQGTPGLAGITDLNHQGKGQKVPAQSVVSAHSPPLKSKN